MNIDCLQYRLTEDERRTFNETGYLQLEGALSPDRVDALTALADGIHAREVAKGFDPKKGLFYPNFIPENSLFQDLVDFDCVLPKVWGILGWNIYLYHAHLIVTPPSGESLNDKTYGWHQDSGRVNMEMESHPRPRLSLKVAYFLSDTSEPGGETSGSFPAAIWRTRWSDRERHRAARGGGTVLAKPGTAVLFDRRLWHAGTPNGSDVTRKVLFYGYSYRWLRTKDDMTVQSLWERSDPIRRQLLGWGVNCNGFYTPSDEDVPLRTWLREHAPEDAK
jgi:hypothetical protein